MSSVEQKRGHGQDDLADFVDGQMADPLFQAAAEDALSRSKLIEFFTDLRRRKGLTQKDVARLAGTTQSAVSEFEKSVTEPRLATLQRWARAFGFRLELQLWEGPLLYFNSWVHRTLPYESAVHAVRVDQEMQNSWHTLNDEPWLLPYASRCLPMHVSAAQPRVRRRNEGQGATETYMAVLSRELNEVTTGAINR